MHLLTATDPEYFSHVLALLGSFRESNDGQVFVYSVGLSDLQTELLHRLGAFLLPEEAPGNVGLAEFVVCHRILAVRGVLEQLGDESLLLLDADSLVRRRLDVIDSILGQLDVGLQLRPGRNANRRVYGGFLAFRPTAGTHSFLGCYEERLSQRGVAWYADQWAIHQSFRQTRRAGQTRFAEFPPGILSRRLDGSAPIWSPSQTPRRSQKFRAAATHYRSTLLDNVRDDAPELAERVWGQLRSREGP